jgi:hypothetical protein
MAKKDCKATCGANKNLKEGGTSSGCLWNVIRSLLEISHK